VDEYKNVLLQLMRTSTSREPSRTYKTAEVKQPAMGSAMGMLGYWSRKKLVSHLEVKTSSSTKPSK